MEKYLDKSLSPEERAQDLLSKMSLEEKMGQIVGIFAFPTSQLPKEQLDGRKQVTVHIRHHCHRPVQCITVELVFIYILLRLIPEVEKRFFRPGGFNRFDHIHTIQQ